MKLLTRITAIAFFLFSAGAADAQNRSIKFEEGSWAGILAKAKKENRIIYLDCYTSWCGPCKWMAKNVFTNDTVADFYNTHFISAGFDMEKGEGTGLAVKYGIRAYPTMLYLDGDGNVLHRTCGSAPAQNFIDGGRDALDPGRQLAGYTRQFNSGKTDGEFASAYFAMLENGCQSYDNELKAYFESRKPEELTSRINWSILYKYLNDYSSPAFAYLEQNREAFGKLYTADSVQDKINKVYSAGLVLALRKKDSTGYELLKRKVKESNNPDAAKIILESDLKKYQLSGDWDNYAATALRYAGSYAMNDANTLNSLAWSFYEHISDKAMLAEAEKWAQQACRLKGQYAYYDTYAAVLYKSGKKAEAKKAAEDAIGLAQKSGEDYSETTGLLKKIERMK